MFTKFFTRKFWKHEVSLEPQDVGIVPLKGDNQTAGPNVANKHCLYASQLEDMIKRP
jgi:hypothetical protein